MSIDFVHHGHADHGKIVAVDIYATTVASAMEQISSLIEGEHADHNVTRFAIKIADEVDNTTGVIAQFRVTLEGTRS